MLKNIDQDAVGQLIEQATTMNGQGPREMLEAETEKSHSGLVNSPWARLRNSVLREYPSESVRMESLREEHADYRTGRMTYEDALAILGTDRAEWKSMCLSVRPDKRGLLPTYLIYRLIKHRAEAAVEQAKRKSAAPDTRIGLIWDDDALLWTSAETVLKDHLWWN